MLTRRGLLRGLAGLVGVASVPEVVRSYFLIGQPERRVLHPLLTQKLGIYSHVVWYDLCDNETVRVWQRALTEEIAKPSPLFDAVKGGVFAPLFDVTGNVWTWRR